jgi:hypothetical protein
MNQRDIKRKFDYYSLSGLHRRAIQIGDFNLAKHIGKTLKLMEQY